MSKTVKHNLINDVSSRLLHIRATVTYRKSLYMNVWVGIGRDPPGPQCITTKFRHIG